MVWREQRVATIPPNHLPITLVPRLRLEMGFRRLCLLLGFGGGASSRRYWPSARNWTFDYFAYNAAKRSLRERFAANLILAPIFSETMTESAFQKKSARFSQKSSSNEDGKSLRLW